MFAMDCAAMTGTDVRDFIEKWKNANHSDLEYLVQIPCHHLGKPLHVDRVGRGQTFFEVQEPVGAAKDVSVIDSDCDLSQEGSALVCDYSIGQSVIQLPASDGHD